MKVLNKGVMPDGTKIQMEDWHEDFPTIHTPKDVVAAYPIAKHYATRSEYEGISYIPCVHEYPERYRTFRLALQFPCTDDAEAAYNNLLNGVARLLDYEKYFQEKKYANCLR